MKKFLAMILCAIMLLPSIPITVGAERGTRYGDYLYYEKYYDYIEITDCDTNAVSVDVPAEIDGLPVTSIGDHAFYNCNSLTSVTISDSVISIDDRAFYKCESLTSVTIPESVISIGNYAFMDCSSLTRITIPDSVTSIGNHAFNGCSGLTSVTIPSGVTSIGDDTFMDCSSLTSITIPDSVTSIGNHAFNGCSGLTSVTIPSGVTSIGNYAFMDCSSLTSIIIPESVTSIGEYAFCQCCKLSGEIKIPDGVESIGNKAFYSCDLITHINIPYSVENIGTDAFDECDMLSQIEVDANNKFFSSQDGILFNKDRSTLIKYPEGKKNITSYSVPEGVTELYDHALANNSVLKYIYLPDTIKIIGNSTFEDCDGMKSITIPAGVTTIGNGPFLSCDKLTEINVDKNSQNYCDIDGVLFNKDKNNLIQYPNGKKDTEYLIPDGVTSISERAFDICTSLISITIPDSVTSIGYRAFRQCNGLTSLTIPDSVTSIGDWAFTYCIGLTNVTIGNRVKSIGNATFSGCESLTSVTIPSSVTSIGRQAFNNCNSLTDVYYSGNEADWQGIDIGDYNKYLTGATIHYNSTGIPQISVSEPVVEGGSITITAETKNIEDEGELFAVGYDGSKLTASEKLQDGAATLPAEGVKTIKVFCWDSLDTMRPLCEPKTITIK